MNKESKSIRRVVGIDVSDASIEACVVERSGGDYRVVKTTKVKLNIGIVEKGTIKNARQLQIAIQKLIKVSGIEERDAVLSLPENAMYMISEEVSLDKKQDIRKAVEDKLLGVIPEPIKEMAVMHEIVPEADSGRLFIRATKKENLLNLKNEFELAGFKILAIESEAEAKARSVVQDLGEGKAVLLMDIGARKTTISIFDWRGISLSTTLPFAGDALTERIAEKTKKPIEEVEKLKKELGLSAEGEATEVRDSILEVLEKIIKEIKETKSYYEKSSVHKLSEILILGGGGRLKGLREYLMNEIEGVKVGFAKTWVKSKGGEIFSYYQTAIGLALKGLDYKNSLSRGNLLAALGGGEKDQQKKPTLLEKLKSIFQGSSPKSPKNTKSSKKFVPIAKRRSASQRENIPVRLAGERVEKPIQKEKKFAGKQAQTEKKRSYKPLLLIIPSVILILGSLSLVVYELFFRADESVDQTSTGRSEVAIDDVLLINRDQLESGGDKLSLYLEEITKDYSFKSTGQQETTEYVTGVVTITNDTENDYNLVATTRLITADGKLYRMDEATSVPAGKKVDVKVTADESGDEYVLDKDVKMTFPGLSDLDIDDRVYATSKSGFAGSGEKYVTQKDLENAREEIEASIDSIDFSDIIFGQEGNVLLSEEVYDVEIADLIFSASKGDAADSFEGTATLSISKIGIEESDLKLLVSPRIGDFLLQGERAGDYELRTCSLGKLDSEGSEVLGVEVQCEAIKKL